MSLGQAKASQVLSVDEVKVTAMKARGANLANTECSLLRYLHGRAVSNPVLGIRPNTLQFHMAAMQGSSLFQPPL